MRWLACLSVLLILLAGAVFVVRFEKKFKKLHRENEDLVATTSNARYISHTSYDMVNKLTVQVDSLKAELSTRIVNEHSIHAQLVEIKAIQASSRRDIDRLTLTNKAYEMAIEDLQGKYDNLKKVNEELMSEVRFIEEMGKRVIDDMREDLAKKVNSEEFREEIIRVVEEVVPQKVREEFTRMFEDVKDAIKLKQIAEEKFSVMPKIFAEETGINVQQDAPGDAKLELGHITSLQPLNLDSGSLVPVTESKEMVLDLGIYDLLDPFDTQYEFSDFYQENETAKKDQAVQAYINSFDLVAVVDEKDSEVCAMSKSESKREESTQLSILSSPFDSDMTDGFVEPIEQCEDSQVTCRPEEALFKDVRSWREKYLKKLKDLLEVSVTSTKKSYQTAKDYIDEKMPTATMKVKDFGQRIKEKTHKLKSEVREKIGTLAEKAKRASKRLFSMFNR